LIVPKATHNYPYRILSPMQSVANPEKHFQLSTHITQHILPPPLSLRKVV